LFAQQQQQRQQFSMAWSGLATATAASGPEQQSLHARLAPGVFKF
jgi:hypothetical protein